MTNYQQHFETNGYLVIENFNSIEACDTLMQRGEALASASNFEGHPSVFQTSDQVKNTDDYFLNSGGNVSFFFEKDAFDENGQLKTNRFHSMNKIGHALHDLDPDFNAFSRSPQMKVLAQELGLDNYVIIQSMLILKHAKIGRVVDLHQDATFLYTEPVSCIGFWFALEDASVENGCLWAMPGGHRTPLRSWFKRKEGGGTEMIMLNNEPFSTEGMVALEVKKGACVVLHGLLPHYSLPNTSGRSRQAYSIHAIDPNTRYPKENWLFRNMSELKGF
ncbi:MAG: phytanoyl-CoA dioxygenase family protein [Chitinophagaceae bacterium]